MKKELSDAGLTVKWALDNIKKLGEKLNDPKYAAVAKEVSVMVLKWNEAIDVDGLVVPPGKRLPEQKQIEDAAFEEEDNSTPTKID